MLKAIINPAKIGIRSNPIKNCDHMNLFGSSGVMENEEEEPEIEPTLPVNTLPELEDLGSSIIISNLGTVHHLRNLCHNN